MKMVTPSGEILEIDEERPGAPAGRAVELRAVRDRLRGDVQGAPAAGDGGRAQGFKLEEYARKLPELFERGQSIMMYIFPYLDSVGVEFRRYTGPADQAASRPAHRLWKLRNFVWKTFMPGFGAAVTERYVPRGGARYRDDQRAQPRRPRR